MNGLVDLFIGNYDPGCTPDKYALVIFPAATDAAAMDV